MLQILSLLQTKHEVHIIIIVVIDQLQNLDHWSNIARDLEKKTISLFGLDKLSQQEFDDFSNVKKHHSKFHCTQAVQIKTSGLLVQQIKMHFSIHLNCTQSGKVIYFFRLY